MAPAPPPPPGPPPPPMMPLAAPSHDSNQRGLLLQSIREGTKLKKTVTVDKSAPFIPGKTSSVTSGNCLSNESSRDVVSSSAHRNQMNVNGGGPPGLGGLFAHGMPKLKPTGLSIGIGYYSPCQRIRKKSEDTQLGCKKANVAQGATNNSVSSKELHPMKGLSSDTKARGPPPQPPPASQKPSLLSSASDSTLASVNGTSARPAPPVLPSKPPLGGYGKPNVAPKPPVAKEPISPNQSSLHSHLNNIGGSLQALNDNRAASSQNLSILGQNDQLGKPSPPPKKISVNGRPGVNRAQSMRAPRSPPVAPTTTPPFPPNVKHNLVKSQGTLHQSQDSLNIRSFMASKMGTLPHNFIQKVSQLPPSTPPPPTPTQSQRGTPTRPPISRPPPPPSRPPAPSAPPPPPPHRTVHAPPPPPPPAPPIDRLTSGASNSGPPAPPTRNSSMRNGVAYITEIEARFSHLFHSIQEFPEPGVYRRVVKNYNTKTTANAKQPAPQPPVHSQSATHVQLNSKMWVNNTSQC